MADRIIRVQPAPFPGFDDTIIEEYVGDNGDDTATDTSQAATSTDAGTETTPAAKEGATEGAGPKPLALDPDALYIHPLTQEQVRGADLQKDLLRQADYTRKTQELAPFAKQIELYRISPKFRKAVDAAGAEVLGIEQAEGDPGSANARSKEEWNRLFDEDPATAMQEFLRANAPATPRNASAEEKVDLLFAQARGHLGEDWDVVQERILAKRPTMRPEEYQRYNQDANAMFRLIYDTHKELQRERAAPAPGTKPAATAARASVSDAGGIGSTGEAAPKEKNVWAEDRAAFFSRIEKIKNKAPHTVI